VDGIGIDISRRCMTGCRSLNPLTRFATLPFINSCFGEIWTRVAKDKLRFQATNVFKSLENRSRSWNQRLKVNRPRNTSRVLGVPFCKTFEIGLLYPCGVKPLSLFLRNGVNVNTS